MEAGAATSGGDQYPVQFSVEYPDRDLDRLTTAFRIIVAIPIVVVLGGLGGGELSSGWGNGSPHTGAWVAGAGAAIVFFPALLMIVFRQKYPRWWFDWNLELMRFENRVGVYLGLLDDKYPSTDEQQSVKLDFPYPDAKQDLNRWLPLVKWFLAIPHFIVLVLPGYRRDRVRDHRVVRDHLHRSLSQRALRLRRGRHPLGEPRHRLRIRPSDR